MRESYTDQLTEIARRIKEAYDQKAESARKRGAILITCLSVKDLTTSSVKNASRPPVGRFELLDSWRRLVAGIQEKQVFLDYVSSLVRGFVEIDQIEKAEYGRLKTLVDLLSHAVQNHERENSIECRFVTLLEVMRSYGPGWEPSEQVSQFWVRLMQRIPADMAPVNFRRKAYRVLVSLTWVPSSKGLLDACSFDEQKQVIDFSQAPVNVVRAHVSRIRGGQPRPRYDLVNQLLDRLKDETDVCVAITSEKEGMGKTTLAAQVASHPSIQKVFTVLWLKAVAPKRGGDQGDLSYDRYTEYLDDLCEQIEMHIEWPEAIRRFEEPAIRSIREKNLMLQAKQAMSEVLLEKNENILLILDDVRDASLIQWFRFNERQSVIVTTPDSDLDGVDWTVELECMSEEEAVELFLLEANLPINHILGSTIEVQSIVKRCEYNPLTVRTIARFFQLKQVTAGGLQAIEEVIQALENLATPEKTQENPTEEDEPVEDDPHMFLFDVLSLMMGPIRVQTDTTSALFVLCFAALVVVFPSRVPLDEILLLWEQVIKLEPIAIDEVSRDGCTPSDLVLRKHAWFIAEGLVHMGLIQVDEQNGSPWVEVHHHLYKEFAVLMASEMELKGSFEESIMEWNTAFVTAYFSQRIQREHSSVDDNSWEYAIENLPSHMLKGNMLQTAEIVLAEQNFFKARIEAMGWRRAMKVQVTDCGDLQLALSKNKAGSSEKGSSGSLVFRHTAELVKELADTMVDPELDSVNVEIARMLYNLGFAQASLGYHEDAITLLEEAQGLLLQSDPLLASVLYGAARSHLFLNETGNALQQVKACRGIMEQCPDPHPLHKDMLLLFGDVLVAECEYKEAAELYELAYKESKAEIEISGVQHGCVLRRQAHLNHMMGQLHEAEAKYEECLEWKQKLGERSKSMAMAYASLGDVCMELRKKSQAKKRYELALDMLEELDLNEGELDYLLVNGKFLLLRGDYYGSSTSFEMAHSIITDTPDLVMDKSAYDLRCMSRTYQAQGDFTKAVDVLRESVALTFNRPSSLERAFGLTDLGNCLLDMEETHEGLVCLEKALEIQITKLGETTRVLDSLKVIGNVHLSLNAHEDALVVFRKIHEVSERIASGDTERIAEALYLIAEAHEAKGEHNEAIEHFHQSMELLKRDRASDHPDIAKALQRLGSLSVAEEDLDKAYDYFSRAHEIRKKYYSHGLLAETQYSLGLLKRKRGELQAAQELLLDALETRRQEDNSPPQPAVETLLEIGNIYRLQSDLDSALSIYEKGLELLGKDDTLSASLNLAAGHVFMTKGRYSDALLRYGIAREARLQAFGRDDMKTGNTSRSLGLAHFMLNRADESLVHLNEFVRICEQQEEDASETIDYAMAVLLLGDIYNSRRNVEQANNVWTVAREVCEDNDLNTVNLDFVKMIDRRLDDGETKSSKGLFSKLGIGGDKLIELMTDPDERKVLENLLFMDD